MYHDLTLRRNSPYYQHFDNITWRYAHKRHASFVILHHNYNKHHKYDGKRDI